MKHERLIIIGSGPAGYTAAIYASRAQLSPMMFTGKEAGGQLMGTTEVENFPGFPEGILGPELMEKMKKQAERFGARLAADDVVSVDVSAHPFIVKTATESVEAGALIISTGASAKWLNVPGEAEYKGRGVSACATCDGFFFRGKDVVVVGGGDAAAEEALYLKKFAKKIIILVRSEIMKASKIMQERVMNDPQISILWNTETREVIGDGKVVTGLRVVNNKTQKEQVLSVQGLFVAIGHKPNTDLFQGKLNLNPVGYILTEPQSTRTNVEGIFACGDVADPKYRQAISAAGTGCMAAIDAERYLANH